MPGRKFTGIQGKYRYGFNGAEKIDEISGEGNVYDLGFRNYDTRLGRMWKIDPLAASYAWQSPYAYHRNNPIAFIDYLGGGDPPTPEEDGSSEGEKQSTKYDSDFLADPGNEVNKRTQDWYWHDGSSYKETTDDNGNTTTQGLQKGWYKPSEYRGLIASGSWNPSTPLNIRMIIADVTGQDANVDETDLSTDELIALRNIVMNNVKNGKMKISYSDYATTSSTDPLADVASNKYNKQGESTTTLLGKVTNANYILKTTLGQASIIHENGSYYVVDSYDFNDAPDTQNNKGAWGLFKSFASGVKQAGGNPYKQARNLGSHYGSKPGAGISIKIKLW